MTEKNEIPPIQGDNKDEKKNEKIDEDYEKIISQTKKDMTSPEYLGKSLAEKMAYSIKDFIDIYDEMKTESGAEREEFKSKKELYQRELEKLKQAYEKEKSAELRNRIIDLEGDIKIEELDCVIYEYQVESFKLYVKRREQDLLSFIDYQKKSGANEEQIEKHMRYWFLREKILGKYTKINYDQLERIPQFIS